MERRATIMTVDEVARYLRVHSMTVYRLIRRGDLPAMRVGRNWRFSQDQINQWLVDREINSNHRGTRRSGAGARRKRDARGAR